MTERDWAPDACTLPTADRPLRLAEFDGLFHDAVRRIDRVSTRHLRLRLDGAAEPAARDLIVRESACCSFFTFHLTRAAGDVLMLDIRVPPARVDVLDALAERATPAPRR
ncbi:hypothetical protein [Micromonospora robiginosa]|uniref:Arsenate reductase n=1 Tax=Micromonospora robiginosa TaxID=2749844 RepID=A0A7L6B1T4_9ACTN|nr:hypothetical protein [Micromonospora ferruginea]QLQ35600.1 hypothetical protein H1D33_19740 [Micromonospora ferruginea]